MKYCLIKPNQISEVGGADPDPLVLIPKALAPKEDEIIIRHGITYDDVLYHLKSELDLVFITEYNTVNTELVNNNNELQLYNNRPMLKMEDEEIELLGYDCKPIKSDKGFKIIIADIAGNLYRFDNFITGKAKKENIITLISKLFEMNVIYGIHFKADYKIGFDENDLKNNHYYIVTKKDYDPIELEESFENKCNTIHVNGIMFSKVLTRFEANDVLKVLKDNIKNLNIIIDRVRLEELYELV
ncbi:hypothetical protein [Romboutsia ilealis]|uniref:hypothetical protein n=1 Tax=Romboutsia ilealis TaxID=1115758 RepID=UPI00272A372C|nr:hypothetical protein [Romboutsia ilealis]